MLDRLQRGGARLIVAMFACAAIASGCSDDAVTGVTPDAASAIDGPATPDGGGPDAGPVDAGAPDATPTGEPDLLACRILNVPAKMPAGSSTRAPGSPVDPAAVQVAIVLPDASSMSTCGNDFNCMPDHACVAGVCRQTSAPSPSVVVSWSSSNTAVATVESGSTDPGRVTAVAAGTSQISATAATSFVTLQCPTRASATAQVEVTDRMLCDVIVTTRPLDPSANTSSYDTGAGEFNRMGRSRGIRDGSLPGLPQAFYPGDADGIAKRRAYYGPHVQAPQAPAPGSDPDPVPHQYANDPRFVLPNVDGVSQRVSAVGYFATDGQAASCGTNPASLYTFDVTGEATWDVVSTPSYLGPADVTGAATGSPAVNVTAGTASVIASATVSRVQAVRATIASGARNCTGNGTAIGTRGVAESCRHALLFEVCGTPDASAGAFVVTPWISPLGTNRSPFNPGIPNTPRETTTPTVSASDFYETFAGDLSIQYYALQRFVGACQLPGGSTYRMDMSDAATWSSSNPAFAQVSGGRLTALAPGSTSITAQLTYDGNIGVDTLPFRVAGGVIDGISATPSAAIAEIIPGSASADGNVIRNEVWLRPVIHMTAGTAPVVQPGDSFMNIEWVLTSGDPNCVEQYDGAGTAPSDWRPFTTVGFGSGSGVTGTARFRARAPFAAACSVVLRPRCGNSAVTCSPFSQSYEDATISVREGSLVDFFVQAPGRTCADAPATTIPLATYAVSTGSKPGTATDPYVCARTSFGAWLVWDYVFGDGTDAPDLDWDITQGGTLVSMDPTTNLVRSLNAGTGIATVRAQLAAAGLEDTIDLDVTAATVDTLSIRSPNAGATASAECLALDATPGVGTVGACLARDQAEWMQVFGSGSGLAEPIDLTLDPAIILISSAFGCVGSPITLTGPRNRIALAPTPALQASGYCTAALSADVAPALVPSDAVATTQLFLAILTGPFSGFTAGPAIPPLVGPGELVTPAASIRGATDQGEVPIDVSYWAIGSGATTIPMPLGGVTPADPAVLGGVAPRFSMWHPIGMYPYPGHPFFALVYSRAVPVAQTTTLRATVPISATSVEWPVSVAP